MQMSDISELKSDISKLKSGISELKSKIHAVIEQIWLLTSELKSDISEIHNMQNRTRRSIINAVSVLKMIKCKKNYFISSIDFSSLS